MTTDEHTVANLMLRQLVRCPKTLCKLPASSPLPLLAFLQPPDEAEPGRWLVSLVSVFNFLGYTEPFLMREKLSFGLPNHFLPLPFPTSRAHRRGVAAAVTASDEDRN